MSLAEAETRHPVLTVLHTNDLHSHFDGSGPDRYVSEQYARLATKIRQVRNLKTSLGHAVLLLDSGDFFSGTLFHLIGPNRTQENFPELEFFKAMSYDGFTLGNHEFDAGEKGLEFLLEKARRKNLLQGLVVSNAYFRNEPSPLNEVLTEIPGYFVKNLQSAEGPIKIGILGIVGEDAARVSSVNRPTLSFLGYDDEASRTQASVLYRKVQGMIDQLRTKDSVDLVIVLFHGGNPEDRKLAQNVKGIDLIVAGHTHEAYIEPRKVGKTYIVQTGSYARNLGQLDFSFIKDPSSEQGYLALKESSSALIPIGKDIEPDPVIKAEIVKYKNQINKIIAPIGYSYETAVGVLNRPLIRKAEVNNELGIHVTSGILAELNRRLGKAPQNPSVPAPTRAPIDVYLTSLSLIRENMILFENKPTQYQFSDIFRMLSIGFSEEGDPGSPVVSFYLEKSDLVKIMDFLEVFRSVSVNFTPAYSSSLKYRVRSWGIPFINRITDLFLNGKPYSEWPKYVHLATNAYAASFFFKLSTLSHGWIRLSMRNQNGEVVTSPTREPVPPEALLFADSMKKLEIKN